MSMPNNVITDPDYPIPERQKSWVLADPGELKLVDKPIPSPKHVEVLVRIDAIAVCPDENPNLPSREVVAAMAGTTLVGLAGIAAAPRRCRPVPW